MAVAAMAMSNELGQPPVFCRHFRPFSTVDKGGAVRKQCTVYRTDVGGYAILNVSLKPPCPPYGDYDSSLLTFPATDSFVNRTG
jgi:hypothetical protein